MLKNNISLVLFIYTCIYILVFYTKKTFIIFKQNGFLSSVSTAKWQSYILFILIKITFGIGSQFELGPNGLLSHIVYLCIETCVVFLIQELQYAKLILINKYKSIWPLLDNYSCVTEIFIFLFCIITIFLLTNTIFNMLQSSLNF